MSEREKWFLDRIGKRIYRSITTCPCAVCVNVYETGLVVSDEMHASYLQEVEAVDLYEGGTTKYFDTLEERDAYESKLKEDGKA